MLDMVFKGIKATHSAIGFPSGTFLSILVLGLAIRFALIPFFTYPYDIEHWAIIMQNSESGNALFGLTGYFYTPVWGYLLNLGSFFLNSFLTIGEYGSRFADLFGIEGLHNIFYTATTTSPAFNCAIKIPLVIVDVVVGYLLYRLIMHDTEDVRKATAGFGLWFLCPVVIYMSSVQATFDCICALVTILSLLLLRNDRCFLAGAMLALAALTKFFPAFLAILFCIYVIKVHENDGKKYVKLAEGVIGAAFMFALMVFPQVLDGTLANEFTFFSFRMSESSLLEWSSKTIEILALLFVMIYTAIRMYKGSGETVKQKLFFYSLAVLAASVLMRIGPQYSITFLPLLAYFAVIGNRHYKIGFIVIGIIAMLAGFMNNSLSLLTTAVEYYGMWDVTSLINAMEMLDMALFDSTVQAQIISLLNIVQRVTIILLLLFMWEEDYDGKRFAKFRSVLVKVRTVLTRCNDEGA